MSDELDNFIEKMLDDKQLSGVTDEVRAQLVIDLKERLSNQIDRALVDALTDEQAIKFEQLLDNPDTQSEQLQQFFIDNNVDVKRVTVATMIRFYDLYVRPVGGSKT